MKVLLLTRNHVVREFVELVADRVGVDLDVHEHVSDVDGDAYDLLFVDDRGELLEESIALRKRLKTSQSIVLFGEESALHASFDRKIKKPFLPSDIQHILEEQQMTEEDTADQILNLQDIEEIKSLLEDEGMEIVSEEDLVDEITMENTLQIVETETVNSTTEEKLLKALLSMEPKKIRKLLKGAEVTLRIKFPKESK